MAKTTILAIFMIVVVLGMAMKETQGQEDCHEYYTETGICEHNQCAAQCASKRNGTGRFSFFDASVDMEVDTEAMGTKVVAIREEKAVVDMVEMENVKVEDIEVEAMEVVVVDIGVKVSGYGYGNRYSGGRGGYSRGGGGG
ncbi:hypothetical protein F2Q69_00062328 [Brassica cretica]|uniref:Uncharacterized protein n=1 Tax=Brassica cretica TaxID=69181 RepID=A0A8S9RPD4_BRACR|nr:hypothetical protein F2Q69_00062328 [Brassica cretica]